MMSSRDSYNTVPYDSRSDWISQRAAARLFGVRYRQVTGWVYNGHVISCKRGNKRLVSEESCRKHFARAKMRDRCPRAGHKHNRAHSQAPQDPPPIHCEVVPIQVGGAELAGIRLNGQEVIAAQLLEKILELQPRSISSRVGRDEWFVSGKDYVVLRGDKMKTLREEVVDKMPTTSLLYSPQLMILTEDGVTKVLTTIRSRVTDVLAGTLYGSNFMRRAARAVMQGDKEAFARNMADDATDALAQCRAQIVKQQAQIDSMAQQVSELRGRVAVNEQDTARHSLTLDRVSTILQHLVNDSDSSQSRHSGQSSSDFVCTMTATEVVKHLSRMVKVPLSEKKVHQIARKIEVREHGGQYYGTGLAGHSERCRINGSYYIWHYSPAMIALIKNFITGGQCDMWGD
tara:strand:+ start:1155 stop:2357 length:1203 start_codon:yes stop_codon:yes gene_type:complete